MVKLCQNKPHHDDSVFRKVVYLRRVKVRGVHEPICLSCFMYMMCQKIHYRDSVPESNIALRGEGVQLCQNKSFPYYACVDCTGVLHV